MSCCAAFLCAWTPSSVTLFAQALTRACVAAGVLCTEGTAAQIDKAGLPGMLFQHMGDKKEDDEFVLQITFTFAKLLAYAETRGTLLRETDVVHYLVDLLQDKNKEVRASRAGCILSAALFEYAQMHICSMLNGHVSKACRAHPSCLSSQSTASRAKLAQCAHRETCGLTMRARRCANARDPAELHIHCVYCAQHQNAHIFAGAQARRPGARHCHGR